MRTVAISALLFSSLTAGCGDSAGSNTTEDAGTGGENVSGNNGGPVSEPQEDDEDLDNDCDYDPCCVGNDNYDFQRCNPAFDAGMKDSAVPASDASADDAAAGDAAAGDAGPDAGADAGKTE